MRESPAWRGQCNEYPARNSTQSLVDKLITMGIVMGRNNKGKCEVKAWPTSSKVKAEIKPLGRLGTVIRDIQPTNEFISDPRGRGHESKTTERTRRGADNWGLNKI